MKISCNRCNKYSTLSNFRELKIHKNSSVNIRIKLSTVVNFIRPKMAAKYAKTSETYALTKRQKTHNV